MIKRVLKMLGALVTGTGMNIATQIVLPPLFLRSYGVTRYGEWIVLSGTVSYLATLNFGISTYASNELTMMRKRGKLEKSGSLQASMLALLLGMLCIGCVLAVSVLVLPLNRVLHLSNIAAGEAAATAFLLGLQVLVQVLGGYFGSLFMVVEEAHRGVGWGVARGFAAALVTCVLAAFGLEFHWLAAGQLTAVAAMTAFSVVDLRRKFRGLPLGLRGATWKVARQALRPSALFAMIFAQQFLTYQAPLILLQWILGPSVVVVFSIGRTILSSARQVLGLMTNAIAPEITLSYAARDRERLLAIFHYSERLVFAVIPVANLGAFLFAPVLLRVWLHRPELFSASTYVWLTLVSAAVSMREHKQFFQFATNMHRRLAMIVLTANLLFIGISIPVTLWFGLNGFLKVWLASEVAQMAMIYRENKRLFDYDASITLACPAKLVGVMAVSLTGCWWLSSILVRNSLDTACALGACATLVVAVECYVVFGISEVWANFGSRVRFRHHAV